jgi:hypothetical protein
METILHQSAPISFVQTNTKASVFSRFMNWCEGQEKYRFGWLAAALSIHGCALTPITLFAIILAGTNIAFFVLALIAMGMALVTNLAAMPTKVTIPVFLLSIVIDIAIIISCVAIGFDITGTYV